VDRYERSFARREHEVDVDALDVHRSIVTRGPRSARERQPLNRSDAPRSFATPIKRARLPLGGLAALPRVRETERTPCQPRRSTTSASTRSASTTSCRRTTRVLALTASLRARLVDVPPRRPRAPERWRLRAGVTMAAELLFAFALVAANGFFVASEFAIARLRPTQVSCVRESPLRSRRSTPWSTSIPTCRRASSASRLRRWVWAPGASPPFTICSSRCWATARRSSASALRPWWRS
jgi:hypothetical protein